MYSLFLKFKGFGGGGLPYNQKNIMVPPISATIIPFNSYSKVVEELME